MKRQSTACSCCGRPLTTEQQRACEYRCSPCDERAREKMKRAAARAAAGFVTSYADLRQVA